MKTTLLLFQVVSWTLALLMSTNSIARCQEITSRYEPVLGKPHADFALPSIDDNSKITLSDFRGKKVVLIHFASW
jgi:hypothetical protein